MTFMGRSIAWNLYKAKSHIFVLYLGRSRLLLESLLILEAELLRKPRYNTNICDSYNSMLYSYREEKRTRRAGGRAGKLGVLWLLTPRSKDYFVLVLIHKYSGSSPAATQ